MNVDPMLAFTEVPNGIPVYVNKMLSPRPLERETFSGGWNESARQRNRRKIAQSIYRVGGAIHCSPEGFEMLLAEITLA